MCSETCLCEIVKLKKKNKELSMPVTGIISNGRIELIRNNIPIGNIPFVYSESQFTNAFGEPLQ